jgi:transcriptional regulator with XRE-family HTH domain
MNFNCQLPGLLERIGRKLYQIRHTRNEKMVSVAKAINCSHAVISQIENGRYYCLSFDMLSKLTQYYQVPIEEILIAENIDKFTIQNTMINNKKELLSL